MAVNIAARIGALSGPGEVLVSRTVKDLVVGSGITFTDRGDRELKGVPDRWRLFAVDTEEESPGSQPIPDVRDRRVSDRVLAGATRKSPGLVRRVIGRSAGSK
jgi:hypothetical protein